MKMIQNIKRLVPILFLVILVGCGERNHTEAVSVNQPTLENEALQETADQKTTQEKTEEYALFVDVYDSHRAKIIIDGLSLKDSYPRNNENLEFSERSFCWGVRLGDYEAAVIYENGRYPDEDFMPLNQDYAAVYRSDSPNERFRIPVEINKNYMIFDLTFPEEEQINLQQLKSFTLEGMEDGTKLCEREVSIDSMNSQSGEFARNRIFPKEVYNSGFITGWGDAEYYKPMTEDYVLFSLGDLNRENMLVSFQPDGKISSMVVRQRICTGQESTAFGLVDSKPDEETMKSNMQGYLDMGYADAGKSGMGTMCVAYRGDCLYIAMDQSTIDRENDSAYADGSYISPKEKILKTKSLDCGPIQYYETGEGYQLYFASTEKVDTSQLKAPEGEDISKFDMLQYYAPITEDYRLVQYGDESYKELISISFDKDGNVIDSKDILYFEDDDSTEKRRDLMNLGYQVHPDNPKVIMGEYQYKEPILTKEAWIRSDKSGATTLESGGILYYSLP